MNKKIRKKIKAAIIKECFPPNRKPLGIFRDMLENAIYLAEELENNPKTTCSTLRVKIVNVNKLIKCGYRWVDSKDIIKNSEPFKVGDIGYINLAWPGEESIPPIVNKLYAECIGVKILREIPLEIKLLCRNSS